MQIYGTRGRIEIEIPFTPPAARGARIFVADGSESGGSGIEAMGFPLCNQYTIQGDLFSQAIRENTEQAIPLEDSLKNMAVIDAVLRSTQSGQWEVP